MFKISKFLRVSPKFRLLASAARFADLVAVALSRAVTMVDAELAARVGLPIRVLG